MIPILIQGVLVLCVLVSGKVSNHGILVQQILSFLVILAKGKTVKFRNLVIQLLKVSLVRLLPNSLCIGIAITAGHGRSLPHGIHHCHLTHLCVLVFVLLIQGIRIQVIREVLPVDNLVIDFLELLVILTRILGHILLSLLQGFQGVQIRLICVRVICILVAFFLPPRSILRLLAFRGIHFRKSIIQAIVFLILFHGVGCVVSIHAVEAIRADVIT